MQKHNNLPVTCEEQPWDGDRHLPNAHHTIRDIVDHSLSDRQIPCWILRWFQPRAYKEAGGEKQDADEDSADPHAIGKTYTPVKQVVQHDGMDDRSQRGSSGDEAHCKRTTLAEIVGCHCYAWDVQHSLSHAKTDPLSKKDLSFRLGGTAHRVYR